MTQQLPFTTSINNGIAQLIFDKPPVNAFDSHGWFAIADKIKELGTTQGVHVVVIGAQGRGFCAGVDIKELAEDGTKITAVNKGNFDTFANVHHCPVPVIAAVHGFVLGGGIGICGASDIIIASDCASFGVPEVDRGALGMGAHLSRMFPVHKVRYMFFTGEMIDAQEAYRLGAVEKVVAKEELMDTALEVAAKIAEKSTRAIRLAKESLNGVEVQDIERDYRYEQGFTLELYTSPDSQEARDAFVEKRDAEFVETK